MDKLNDLQKEHKDCTNQMNLLQFYNERLKEENQEINHQILSLTEDL
jgi:FtsZ-binding cell division protein ZapB